MTQHILIVDDEKNIRLTVGRVLELEGFTVEGAPDGQAGLDRIAQGGVDLVLLDLRLPGIDGLEVLGKLGEADHAPPVVMMSGHGTLDAAVKATRLGASDFLEKPLNMDRMLLTVRNALKLGQLAGEVDTLKRATERRHGMVGHSEALTAMLEQVRRAAPTKARVLIHGESGVGKELVAKAVHDLSKRADKPFVKLNCAAIAENLVESELFGHEKGAFTGAAGRREGRFERADGGTLFLDEIGEMPLSIQSKLLRVLQEGEFERVGGSKLISVDVRIIAATNRDLAAEVEAGNFREDLYYRLNVLPIPVPPLRQRKDDIAELAVYLLNGSCESNELEPKYWSDEALTALKKHDFPGNVRELSHLVDRLAILTPTAEIQASDVERALGGARSIEGTEIPTEGALFELLEALEKRIIEERIGRFDGNMTRAAEDLGLERSHLYKKVRRLGIARS